MGRTVRRVPLDFEWEIGKLWDGYLLPDRLHGLRCTTCGGSGSTTELDWLTKVAYVLCGLADDSTDAARGRPMHPYLTPMREISYGYGSDRPGPKFAEFVDGLVGDKVPADGMFGRDVYRMLNALREAAGLPDQWAWCPDCSGHGENEAWPGQSAEAEAWEPTDPPSGDGWQFWSTTTEGHPMTPVFATAEELAQHCATARVSWFGHDTATADQWLRSFNGEVMLGAKVIAPGVVVL